MRKILSLLALCLGFVVAASAAHARVNISIDLSSQTMRVSSPSGGSHTWAISSARSGYVTPRGSYSPTSLQRMHYSKKYHNSPMPHSIFFRGGYAIHGTYSTGALGSPASHGCVRLAPGNAAALFAMVQREGARISISGSPPNRAYASAKKKYGKHYARAGHKKYKHYAAGRSRGHAPMAYAPARAKAFYGGVRVWQRDPAGN